MCFKNYQLVAPFFELSFGMLRLDGQLGFIVSNAFAKRDFGKPLIENFFSAVSVQKVVDCSGLMFPGHGTPTCLVFGAQIGAALRGCHTRVTSILPGGGDLRTAPEDSPLWADIAANHDRHNFADLMITVHDKTRSEISSWPWRFVAEAAVSIDNAKPLSEYCSEPIGAQFITGKDEAYVVPDDYARRVAFPSEYLKRYGAGEDVRDWKVWSREMIIFPYDNVLRPFNGALPHRLAIHLNPYKEVLENCIISGSIRKKETKLKWFEYRRLARAKLRTELNIIVPQIATHPHFSVAGHQVAFKEKAQAIVLKDTYDAAFTMGITGLLNSSFVADYLKRECFSKRESDQPEKDTYFEFSGKKLENIPIPSIVESSSELWVTLRRLATRCDALGVRVVGCAARALFQGTDPYAVNVSQNTGFTSATDLSQSWTKSIRERETMLGAMIAVQEEIDWLAYAAYDALPGQHHAVRVELEPQPLDRNQRAFCIWAQAEGDYDRAVVLIPSEFSTVRCDLWKARLAAIRDTELIRRIEQPSYKRRWDEQWKVGSQWRCGEIAYAAEFIDAFEWWLKEKAEWWLENTRNGGPANRGEWTIAMWQDERVKAAWTLAAEQYVYLENEKAREKAERDGDPAPTPKLADAGFKAFDKRFKQLIEEESVPAGFEFGTPYDDLAKKLKKPIPTKLQKLRGKLNVPRERFHEVDKDVYQWAGLQFKGKPTKVAAGT